MTRKKEDARKNKYIDYNPLSLQRQTYIIANIRGATKQGEKYHKALWSREHHLGQCAALGTLLAQARVIRHSKKIYEIVPHPLAIGFLSKNFTEFAPLTVHDVLDNHSEHSFDEFKTIGIPPREWYTGDVQRVSMGVNWELFERLSTIGTTLDNRIVVANTSKGVTISIGSITFEHIPKYLDHALYVPYIRTILLIVQQHPHLQI